uniref:DUF177 domain-containing protein n=1 Tax=Erythrolobus australicus TaxID=1077150 RepID=A0A7S1TL59_9RHOD
MQREERRAASRAAGGRAERSALMLGRGEIQAAAADGGTIERSALLRVVGMGDGLDVPDATFDDDERVRIAVSVTRVRGDFYVKGYTRATFQCNCDRCLAPIELDARGTFDVWLATDPSLVPQIDGPDDTRADEAVEAFTPNVAHLDLASHVYDAVMLSIPFKKLCVENCSGRWDDSVANSAMRDSVSMDSPLADQLAKLNRSFGEGQS